MKKSIVVLLHLAYWLLYLILVLAFVLAMSNGHRHLSLIQILFFSPQAMHAIFPAVVGFYVFYSFLFPSFLKPKKITVLVVSGILAAFFIAILFDLISSGLFNGRNIFSFDWPDKIAQLVFFTLITIINGTIGLVIKGFMVWYTEIKLKEELNRKNFEMELSLVKAQINPHFLFNTINNIDVLIRKDPVKASVYLNKLSEIMRFMLYETKSEAVPLAKELDYIEKYIELQKIRRSNPDYVYYKVSGEVLNVKVVPMIFIPFIENAFKFAVDKETGPAIRISLIISKEQIDFSCENDYTGVNEEDLYSGLGNKLIQKRLALLYPKKYRLNVTKNKETYIVNLQLNLNEN